MAQLEGAALEQARAAAKAAQAPAAPTPPENGVTAGGFKMARKIRLNRISRPSYAAEYKEFTLDTIDGPEVIGLCLRPLDHPSRMAAVDAGQTMYEYYCGDKENGVAAQAVPPLIDGVPIEISKTLMFTVSIVYKMQSLESPSGEPIDPADLYSFEELLELSARSDVVWKEISAWSTSLNRRVAPADPLNPGTTGGKG
jgi:hypothetical protein